METFKIKRSSVAIFILIYVIVAVVCLIVRLKWINIPRSIWSSVLFLVVMQLLASFLARLSSESLFYIDLGEDAMHLRGAVNGFLITPYSRELHFNEIAEIRFKPDHLFNQLKIKMVDGKVIRIWHNYHPKRDDFDELLQALENNISLFNEKSAVNTVVFRK